MLNVKIYDSSSDIIHKTDVEKVFRTLRVTGTEYEKLVIQKIEQGIYNDEDSFIDRFGFKLYLSQLSTGCKAALCILNNPSLEISLFECGNNAIDVILSICKNGKVAIVDREMSVMDYSVDGKIDVCIDGYEFTTIDRLNYYLFDERPFPPDITKRGVKHVSKL